MAGSKSVVLTGPCIVLYVNNKIYKEVQVVEYELDYDERDILGIDSPFPQEIAPGKASVSGNIRGIRVRNSGGLQAYNLRPSITDILAAPYVSIRIHDRSTGEDLLFVPNAKVGRQSLVAATKSTAKLSFSFRGLVAYEAADRA